MKYVLSNLTPVVFIFLLVGCNSNTDRYKDEKGNFSIQFGGEPDTTRESQNFGFGTYSWKVADIENTEGMNNYYSVAYLDFPENRVTSDSMRLLAQLFALTQTDYIQQYGEDKLVSTYTRSIKGYPGREFLWLMNDEKKGVTRRYFLVKNRLYRMEVRYPITEQHNIDIGKFFKSFQLLKVKDNPNPEKKAVKPKKKFYARFPGPTKVQYQEIFGDFGPQSMRMELHQINQNNAPNANGNIAYSVLSTAYPDGSIGELTEEDKKEYVRSNFRNNKMFQSGKILQEGERMLDGKWSYEGIVELSMGGNQLVMHVITLIEDNYLYQIGIVSSAGKQNNPDALSFIASFHLNH